MLIKKLSRGLAFFASMSWPGGDKVDLVTFKVRDSGPSCTRVSTLLSAKSDRRVNDQIKEVDIRCPEVNSDDHKVVKVRIFLLFQSRNQPLNRPGFLGLFNSTGRFSWKSHFTNILMAPGVKEGFVMEVQCEQVGTD